MNPPETSALILYNDPQAAAELSQVADSTSVLGVLAEVNAVAAALGRLHIPCRAVPVGSLQDCPGVLNDAPEPLVFNLVEEFPAEPEAAAHVPALCTAFGKACTGADSACLQLTLDKPRTKAVLAAADLPVPAGVMVEPGAACDPALMPPPPWIVKPARADASEGITGASSIHSQADKAFRRNLETVHRSLGQPALVEQLVGDRELNVSVLERNGCPQVLPLAEIDFSAFAPGKARIVDYAAKWLATSFEYRHTPRIIPAPLPAAVAAAIRAAALKAWRVTRCRDYARIDVRMSGDGVFHILEVNANPDIAPDAGFAAALDAAGIAYDDFVRDVAENARQRHQRQDSSAPPVRQPERHPDAAVKTRISLPADRAAILQVLRHTRFFRPHEVAVAAEVLDEALRTGPAGHYQSLSAMLDGRLVGWTCYGPTPCTIGTFDIYWIAVEPTCQKRGAGRVLIAAAEIGMQSRQARLAAVETSGTPRYAGTRCFYRKLGYRQTARIPDFYAPGDDKVIYTKRLAAPAPTLISVPTS